MFKKLLLGASIFSLFLSACTEPEESSKIPMFPEEDDFSNDIEAELYFNYFYLDLYYIYGHARNELSDNYKVYLNKGTTADARGKNFCTEEYYDVCYMYNQLTDPFTHYFDPVVAPQVLASIFETETITGIGAEVEEITDIGSRYIRISDIYPGSPAEKAGLQIGDVIVQIDGLNISSASNFEAMCTGNIGDIIKIVVNRNDELVDAAVTVDEYNEPSVRLTYQDSIPVIQIQQFVVTTISDKGTFGEFLSALKKTEGAKSTIIDLRGNPGGETKQCDSIAAALLSKGDTIIIDIEAFPDSIRDGGYWRYVQRLDTVSRIVPGDGVGKDRYYVVMADTGSASCSESMLSALTANRHVPVVGQLTYGKGIGQIVIDSTYKAGLALITALQSFDKNWESYHDLGIVPDFEIDDPDEQLAKAVELAKEGTYIRTAGYGTRKLNHFSKARLQEPSNKIPTAKDLKLRYEIRH